MARSNGRTSGTRSARTPRHVQGGQPGETRRGAGMAETSSKPVIVAVGAGAAIATAKLVAAGATGSASMLAEGIHSVVDACNDSLLLVGQKRSQRPPDDHH